MCLHHYLTICSFLTSPLQMSLRNRNVKTCPSHFYRSSIHEIRNILYSQNNSNGQSVHENDFISKRTLRQWQDWLTNYYINVVYKLACRDENTQQGKLFLIKVRHRSKPKMIYFTPPTKFNKYRLQNFESVLLVKNV